MKYAFCNEMFGEQPFDKVCTATRALGYTGVEIAPYTLDPRADPFDIRQVPADRRAAMKRMATDAGLQIVGLHWLLAKTWGLHLTTPDAAVRRATIDYVRALVELCAELGGKIMVLGSPQQRNLQPGAGYDDAEKYAAEILQTVMPACAEHGVIVALEPLSPAETNFMLTALSTIHQAEMVDSPLCKLLLDVKAMSSEPNPYETIIKESRDWLVHFHANDPNLLGPGLGEIGYDRIKATLAEINYSGWISLEVFKYEPDPLHIARESIEYLKKVEAAIAINATVTL
jgi:sugar phosphate isomerase/epimerase